MCNIKRGKERDIFKNSMEKIRFKKKTQKIEQANDASLL